MGNAYRIPGARDRLRKQQQQIRDLQANLRNRNTPRAVATTATAGSSAAGSTGGGTGNFLSTEGGTMIGPLALKPPVDFSVDIDSSNTIDISPANTSQQYSSNIQIEDVPTSSTLDIIKGAAFDGQILIIRTFAPPTITISQATLGNGGNIQTPDGNDVTIGDLQIVILVYDDSLMIEENTGGAWRLLNTFSTGGTGSQTPWLSDIDAAGFSLDNLLSLDIEDSAGTSKLNISGPLGVGARLSFVAGDDVIFTENITDRLKINADGLDVFAGDIIQVDRLQMSGGTASATSVNDVVWYLDVAGDLVSNINAGDGWIWSSGNVSKMILTDTTLQKINVTAPIFELFNTRPAQVGTAGSISFLANSTGVPTGITMGFLISDTEVIAGNGRGSLKLGVNLDGTPTSFLTMNEGNDEQVDILKETDFNSQDVLAVNRLQMSGGTASATSVNDVVWYLDVAGDLVSNINAGDGWIWSSGNVSKMILTDSTLEKRNVTAPSFQLYNTIAAQNGTAGTISILANSQNTSTGVTMGFIIGDTEVFTGDGRGALKLGVNLDGTLTSFLTMNEGNDEQVDILKTLDMNSQVIDNVTRINQSGTVPTSGFINMANSSTLAWEASPAGADGTLTFSVNERFIFSDNPIVGTTSGGLSLGVSGVRIGTLFCNSVDADSTLTVAGNTILNGATNFFGNADSDIFTFRGEIKINDITTPANPASGQLTLFVDSADGITKVKKSSGTVVSLESGGGSGYSTIQEEGSSLTQRTTMNFIGSGVTAVDNAGQSRTDITITGDVTGPVSATDNAIARYNLGTGKIIQNSGIIINDSNEISDVVRISQNGTVPTSGFINMANSSTLAWEASPAGADGTLTFSSDERFVFSDNPIVPTTSGGLSLGLSGLRIGTLFVNAIDAATSLSVAGNAILNGATTFIGNADSDILTLRGEFDILDIAEPAIPASGRLTLFVDSADGITKVKKSSGTVVSLEAGSGGANTALSNLASVAINTSLLPTGDGIINLGSAANSWLDTFTERLRIETGGVSTSTANQIIADTGGMIFNTPAGDRYEFNISGSPNGIAIEEDRIEFLTSNRQHRIDATSASINILSENITDSVEIWTGTGRTNATIDIGSLATTFLTQTSDVQAVLIQLIQNNDAPANFRTIGNIDFIAENSASSNEIYARVSASSQDITSGTEDGLLQLGVVSGGTLIASIDMVSNGAGGSLIGFFGVTPVARQSPAANSAAIISALEALGLFV